MRRSREEAELYDSKIHFETNWSITRKTYKDNIIQGYLEMAGHLINTALNLQSGSEHTNYQGYQGDLDAIGINVKNYEELGKKAVSK